MKLNNILKSIICLTMVSVFSFNGFDNDKIAYGLLELPTFSAEEIKLLAANPKKMSKAYDCAIEASNETNKKYEKYCHWEGNGDAFRHAYWSALMTKKIDKEFAWKEGLAHEGLGTSYDFGKQKDEIKMDISNNYSGRQIGETYKDSNDGTISAVCRIHCSNGKFKRVRTRTSKTKGDGVKKEYGVWTIFVGYYKATNKGGLIE